MKIVIVIDRALPAGPAANAAAALAFSVSPSMPDCVGGEVRDAGRQIHPGITNIPLPILCCGSEELAALRREAVGREGLACVDFSDIAQRSKNYADYAKSMGAASPEAIGYLGLCIFGEDAAVRSLTGSLPLLGR
jgi:hypothetical protein